MCESSLVVPTPSLKYKLLSFHISLFLRHVLFPRSPCIYLASKLHYLAEYLPRLASPSITRLLPLLLPASLFPGGLPFVIDPCPGCLGIDWLSPCHWSSLSILTRFGHPACCGQRVGERGRHTRHQRQGGCSKAGRREAGSSRSATSRGVWRVSSSSAADVRFKS